jgi:phosphotransferase system enzyme I (PtsI)
MAGDPSLTMVLIAIGLEQLSMTSGQIPMVKRVIRAVSRADAVALLERAMQFSSAEEIERFFKGELDARFAKLDGNGE